MTDRSTWKRREGDIAKFFFSTRTPLSGGNSKHTRSDSLSPTFYVEAKFRERHAVAELYRDTAAKAKVEGKLPICALCEKGKEGFLLVIDSKHFASVAKAYLRMRMMQRLRKADTE